MKVEKLIRNDKQEAVRVLTSAFFEYPVVLHALSSFFDNDNGILVKKSTLGSFSGDGVRSCIVGCTVIFFKSNHHIVQP